MKRLENEISELKILQSVKDDEQLKPLNVRRYSILPSDFESVAEMMEEKEQLKKRSLSMNNIKNSSAVSGSDEFDYYSNASSNADYDIDIEIPVHSETNSNKVRCEMKSTADLAVCNTTNIHIIGENNDNYSHEQKQLERNGGIFFNRKRIYGAIAFVCVSCLAFYLYSRYEKKVSQGMRFLNSRNNYEQYRNQVRKVTRKKLNHSK